MATSHEPANDNRPPEYDAQLLAHMPFVLRLAHKHRRGDAANDLAQDIYVSALRRWHYYDPKYNFAVWIRLVATDLVYKQRESAGRIKRKASLTPFDDAIVSTPATQHDYAELSETLRRLSGTRDSDVLIRHAMGEDLAEIGADYGIGKERVRQLCERERARLAKRAA